MSKVANYLGVTKVKAFIQDFYKNGKLKVSQDSSFALQERTAV
jgi:hypothetical protein